MAEGVGIGFDISKMLKELERADASMDKLIKNNEKLSQGVISAFRQMTEQGVVPYTQSLEKQSRLLDTMNQAITTSAGRAKSGFGAVKQEIDKATASINTLLTAFKMSDAFKNETNARRESQADQERYQDWLARKHKEEKEHKRVEDAKFEATRNAIAQQNAEYKRVADLQNAQRATNQQTRENSERIIRERDAAYKMYAQMFDDIAKKNGQTAEQVIKKNQEELRQRRKYVNDMTSMYERMFDEIARRESQEDQDRYRDWLARKHKEEKEHKRVEDAKFEATRNAIAQQNAEYKRVADLQNAQRATNQQTRENSERIIRERDAAYKMYAQMFDEIARREKESLERTKKRQRALDNARGDSSKGALNYYNRLYSDKGVMSLNNMNRALQKLRDAQSKLNLSTDEGKKKYKELGNAISKLEKDLARVTARGKSLKNEFSGAGNIVGQLQRKIALLFSVSQITGYVRKLAQVRGEFELQQRALISIVKNSNEAKRIWTQTVELAVKSPFRVKELVTYTKQLAAYRIETEKLFETNKKLADVSAGLGVDMSRLILAYGQVKAANFLRGTELRQFTEAGVNMLDELAKYYSEIEGKSVKVAEVFDRISKRMVTFEDVNEVFNRITGTGGTFYKMQEQQAETLKGQISNLYDSIDIMLNDIGKQNEFVLKGTVGLARDAVQNWQAIANVAIPVIEAITVKWVAFNLFAKDDSAFKKMKAGILGVTNGLKGWAAAGALLKSAFSWTNIITVAIVALSGLVMAHLQHRHELEQINKRYEEMHRRLAAISVDFSKASRNSDVKKMLKEYKELADMAEREYSIKAKIKIDEKSSKEEISKAFNEIQKEVNSQNAFNAAFSEAVLESTQWTVQDDVNEDLAEMGQKYTTLKNNIENYKNSLIKALEAEEQSIGKSEKKSAALEELRKEYNKEAETEEQYVLRISKALSKIHDINRASYTFQPFSSLTGREIQLANKNIYEIVKSYDELKKAEIEAEKEFNEVLDKLDGKLMGLTEKELEIKLKAAIDTHTASKELSSFVTQKVYEFANTRFTINIVPEIKTPKQEELQEWQEKFNRWFGGEGGVQPKLFDFRRANAESTREGMRKYYNDLYKEQEDFVENIKKGTPAYKNEDLKKQLQRLDEIKRMRDFFGPDSTKTTRTGENKALELTKKRIDFVKRLNEEYEKQRELFDDIEAKQIVLDSMGAEGKGLGFDINKMKFTSKADTLKELKKIEGEANKVGATFEYLKAHSDIALDIKVNDKEQDDQKLLREVEKLFSNYEISLELDELQLPKDLQKKLFKVDNISLPELRAQVEAKKDEFTGTDQEKKYQEFLDKISELENKELTERGKKYSKYLVKAQGERVKLKMEELRAISELDEMADKKVITGTQNELAQQNIRKETQAKIDKMLWEEFKDSGMYVRLFEDMEYASTAALQSMQQRLSELKTQLKDLDADDLRNLYNQLEKIEDELAKRNPFKTSVLGIKDYIEALKKRKELEKKAIEEDNKLAEAQKNYNKASDKLVTEKVEYEALDKRVRADGKITKEEQDQLDSAKQRIAIKEGELRAAQKLLDTQKKTTEEANKQNDENKKTIKTFKESVGTVGQYVSQAASALPQVASDMEQVFGTMDASTKDTIDTISEISGGVGEMMTSFASGDIIGTITGLTKTISAIFAIGDKANERQIQKDMKRVERLQKAYEKLEKAIDDAYNINTLEVNTKKARENLEAQIAATERMIKAEDDKKKKDKNRIEQWRDEVDAYKEQLKELEEQRLESLGGIGSDANKKSMTEDFVDAWLEAFKETGDGLSGLEDKFDEFLENYIKKQMTLKVASKYLDPLMADIDAYLGDDNVLDNDELKLIGERSEQAFEIINKALEGLIKTTPAIEDAVGKSSLSGLSKGIQGVTEEQADILASYWNAVRGYTASIDTKMNTVITLLSPNAANATYSEAQRAASKTSLESPSNQPILAELQSQTQIMREIYSMFDSVIGRGNSSHSGAYLKVLI